MCVRVSLENIPSHKHNTTVTISSNTHYHPVQGSYMGGTGSTRRVIQGKGENGTTLSNTHTHGVTVTERLIGGGEQFNTPYKVVYIWERLT